MHNEHAVSYIQSWGGLVILIPMIAFVLNLVGVLVGACFWSGRDGLINQI